MTNYNTFVDAPMSSYYDPPEYDMEREEPEEEPAYRIDEVSEMDEDGDIVRIVGRVLECGTPIAFYRADWRRYDDKCKPLVVLMPTGYSHPQWFQCAKAFLNDPCSEGSFHGAKFLDWSQA